jgi:hypothetical protein
MSTRGVIARPVGDGWEGVFHHWDGMPKRLGKTLWGLYHGHFAKNIDDMRRYLITEHPGGWSTIVGIWGPCDFTKAPGWVEDMQTPPDDLTEWADRVAWARARDYDKPLCYGDARSQNHPIRSGPLDGWLVWCYVLGDDTLTIYKAVNSWELVASYPWNGSEPEWEKVTVTAALDDISDRALSDEKQRRQNAELALSLFKYSGLDLDTFMAALGGAWMSTSKGGRADLVDLFSELHAQLLKATGARVGARTF